MNEKIKELARHEQVDACYIPRYDMWQMDTQSLQKFAELIVRECIRKYQELDDAVVVYSLGEGKEVTKEQLILRHFGFEE